MSVIRWILSWIFAAQILMGFTAGAEGGTLSEARAHVREDSRTDKTMGVLPRKRVELSEAEKEAQSLEVQLVEIITLPLRILDEFNQEIFEEETEMIPRDVNETNLLEEQIRKK